MPKMSFKPEIVAENVVEELPQNVSAQLEDSYPEVDDTDSEVAEQSEDVEDLEIQLECNVAALFLKMSSILNISENALQEVIDQINQIYFLSQPLLDSSVQRILQQHCVDVDDALVNEIAEAVKENNLFLKFTSDGGSLSTASKCSSLHSIQLAVLCKADNIKAHGYRNVLCPLIQDLVFLEQQGI